METLQLTGRFADSKPPCMSSIRHRDSESHRWGIRGEAHNAKKQPLELLILGKRERWERFSQQAEGTDHILLMCSISCQSIVRLVVSRFPEILDPVRRIISII
jgi:hypothetical protein